MRLWSSTTFGNYVEDILGTKLARALPNNVILLPSDKVKLSLLLVERLSSDIWYCPECDDAAKLNMNGVRMVEKEDCKHIFASKILTDMTKEKDLNLNEKDQVFIVETKPSFVAVVYPKTKRCDSKGAQARPGVIQKTPKMSKHRCRTCKGREGCYHLVIFNLAKDEDAIYWTHIEHTLHTSCAHLAHVLHTLHTSCAHLGHSLHTSCAHLAHLANT